MFLDIALGIGAGLGVISFFDLEFSWWLVLLGAVFALLPDLDFLWMLVQRGFRRDRRFDHEHRELLHKPLLFVSIGALALFTFAGPPITVLFVVGALIHFLHDSTGAGWGIRWLHPFSQQYYGICHDGLRKIGGGKWIQSASKKEIASHVRETLDEDHNWISELYLRPSLTLITEIITLSGVFAIIVIYFL